jgi:hypothetical protein
MSKRVNVPQAAQITGLTEYALRLGIKQGRYPHLRTGLGTGKILIDIDLLEQYLEQEAKDNAHYKSDFEVFNPGKLRVVKN